MKTLLVTSPKSGIKAKTVSDLVPKKLAGWQIETLPSGSLGQASKVPDVTLVELDDNTQPAALKAIMPRLAQMQRKGHKGSYVLFSIKKAKTKPSARHFQHFSSSAIVGQINSQLRAFPNPQLVDVTFAQNPSDIAAQLAHIRSKLDLPIQILDLHLPQAAAPHPSPLDGVKEALQATQDLRVSNGNLSAERVANLFGVSLSHLALWLGRSRQALSKTPDADSLQNELAFFERVGRMRVVLPDPEFRKWLRMPNELLGNKSPLDLMAKGEWQIMADYVDDALTGAPT